MFVNKEYWFSNANSHLYKYITNFINQYTWSCVSRQESHVVHKYVIYRNHLFTVFNTLYLFWFQLNSHILCPAYTLAYIPLLKEINPTVRKIYIPGSCPIFFKVFFFFALFCKSNLSQPKTTFLRIDFFQLWHT